MKRDMQKDLKKINNANKGLITLDATDMAEYWIERAAKMEEMLKEAREYLYNSCNGEREIKKRIDEFLGGSTDE